MRRTFVFVLGTLLAAPLACGPALAGATNQASRRNCGPAGVLKGRALLIRIFVTDGESQWNASRIDSVNRRVAAACKFILREAERWKVKDLSFVEDVIHYKADFKVPTSMRNAKWRGRVMTAAAAAAMPKGGEKSPEALRAFFRKKHRADSLVVLIHVNKPGLSFTKCHYRGVRLRGFAECGILYWSYGARTLPTCGASYAHEILHMYGAGELYFPMDRDPRRKKLAAKMFPNAVMRVVRNEIMSLRVSEYTAYRVGWVDKLKKEHQVFEDKG